MKKFTLLKTMLLVAIMVAGSVNAWGDVTYTFSDHFSNGAMVTGGTIDENISYTVEKNSSATHPTYYDSGGAAIRIYGHNNAAADGGSITLIPTAGKVITKVVITATQVAEPTMYYVDGASSGTSVTYSSLEGTISGISASVSLKIQNKIPSTAQLRIHSLTISYEDALGPILSNDATLSNINIDGVSLTGFDPATLLYKVALTPEQTSAPVVTATTTDGGAGYVVTNMTPPVGYTSIDVTAENGITQRQYQIYFYREALAGEKGSEANPFSIAEVSAIQAPVGATTGEKKRYWVTGYIVGCANGAMTNIQTSAFSVASNLVIAAAAGETSAANMLPVELPSGPIRAALNLQDNPTNFGKEVLVYGTLEAYFTVAGIKSVTDQKLITSTGINIGAKEGSPVIASNGQLQVTAAAGDAITVYNILGKVVAEVTAVNGNNIVPVKAGQLLIVKVGNKVTKVITK